MNRRFTLALTVASIALSIFLILGVERLRATARESFTNTVSGIDLIVAARGNGIQILLASVFGVGSTTNAISWETYEAVSDRAEVAWTVPISHGDNHRGFPVVGTTPDYFERFRYRSEVPLTFASGKALTGATHAVVGAEVARRFGYGPGTEIINAHGAGDVAFELHDEAPFTITGVLSETATPVDRMVFVSLEGFDELHADRSELAANADPLARAFATRPETRGPARPMVAHDEHEHRDGDDSDAKADHGDEDRAGEHVHEPTRINAILVGVEDKTALLGLQRYISEFRAEPLSAVLPAATLLELWSITGLAENTLRVVAIAVVVAGLIAMLTMISATLEARRREFAILRSVGATPQQILGLIVSEAAMITIAGIIVGVILLIIVSGVAAPWVSAKFGLSLGVELPSVRECTILVLVLGAGLMASLVPGYRVYRTTLSDGLTMRL